MRRRAEAIGHDVDDLRATTSAARSAELVDKIGRYAESGQPASTCRPSTSHDLDHLRLVAAEVMPQVATGNLNP